MTSYDVKDVQVLIDALDHERALNADLLAALGLVRSNSGVYHQLPHIERTTIENAIAKAEGTNG
jgi:hypothetical protein